MTPQERARELREQIAEELVLFRADCEQWLICNRGQPDIPRRVDRILALLEGEGAHPPAPAKPSGPATPTTGRDRKGAPERETSVAGPDAYVGPERRVSFSSGHPRRLEHCRRIDDHRTHTRRG